MVISISLNRVWGWCKAWLPVILWASLIFYLSAQPDLRISPDQLMDLLLRKAAHMTVFGVLFVLFRRALSHHQSWLAILLTVLYALTDEWHQSFIKGRHADLKDVFIDFSGCLIAFLLLQLIRIRIAKMRVA